MILITINSKLSFLLTKKRAQHPLNRSKNKIVGNLCWHNCFFPSSYKIWLGGIANLLTMLSLVAAGR